mmetsp:Transcript_95337/g.199429  ORF Transcript_95337/g.199429 Transcript_95337/m.199429 type:complete len:371 (+) Transcript_95337:703-1815(+)
MRVDGEIEVDSSKGAVSPFEWHFVEVRVDVLERRQRDPRHSVDVCREAAVWSLSHIVLHGAGQRRHEKIVHGGVVQALSNVLEFLYRKAFHVVPHRVPGVGRLHQALCLERGRGVVGHQHDFPESLQQTVQHRHATQLLPSVRTSLRHRRLWWLVGFGSLHDLPQTSEAIRQAMVHAEHDHRAILAGFVGIILEYIQLPERSRHIHQLPLDLCDLVLQGCLSDVLGHNSEMMRLLDDYTFARVVRPTPTPGNRPLFPSAKLLRRILQVDSAKVLPDLLRIFDAVLGLNEAVDDSFGDCDQISGRHSIQVLTPPKNQPFQGRNETENDHNCQHDRRDDDEEEQGEQVQEDSSKTSACPFETRRRPLASLIC